jgi:hypothetical protein
VAVFTLTVADADVPRVTAALCNNAGYTDVTPENAIKAVMTYITQLVSNVETATARQSALDSIPPIVPINVSSGPPVP